MPQRAKSNRNILANNPLCIFCGGIAPATTVEHCPPRALFQFKHWPETFEFPSCEACNSGTGDHDALVALLARMNRDERQGNADGKFLGLAKNVNRQFPGLMNRMTLSAIEARRLNRNLGIRPSPGQTQQDVAPIKLPDEVNSAVKTFAGKLTKAIYFRETAKIFPRSGTLALHWVTNVALLRHGKYPIFEQLQSFAGRRPDLVRGRKHLNDQIEFKVSLADDHTLAIVQIRVGESFAMVTFACTIPGMIDAAISSLEQKHSRKGALELL